MRCGVASRGFTLIELMVVVAIIALLIAVLLPSLAAARDNARGAVCASNMRTVTTAGYMHLMQTDGDRAPAHQGWVPFVLKQIGGEMEVFQCPSDEEPLPIPAIFLKQFDSGGHYPDISLDGGFFARSRKPIWPYAPSDVAYFETEANNPTAGDHDFDDAYVWYEEHSFLSERGHVMAKRDDTGRTLIAYDWRGRRIAELPKGADVDLGSQPIVWGSFGMNLSAALKDAIPTQILYLDYEDWSAVLEPQLNIRGAVQYGVFPVRDDDPLDNEEGYGAFRHNGRANVAFLDTHVERLHASELHKPVPGKPNSIWHPLRPPGWVPPGY